MADHHGHDHGPTATTDPAMRRRQTRVLRWVLAANAAFLAVEVVGGLVFDSLALLADAAHMLSDVAALSIALVAQMLIDRPATASKTFGFKRAEVLGAQANGIVLLASSGWILLEAARRIGDPHDVQGGGLLAVATIGLLVNVLSAVALARVSAGSLNLRGAMAHLVADAAGSVAAIVSGGAVLLADADWVDPAASVLIALLVLVSAVRLLRDTVHVLLEGAPSDIDPEEVEARLEQTDGVVDVHHLHVWSIGSELPALSAHVVLDADPRLHEAQVLGDSLRTTLRRDFGIGHVTLELECHECETPVHE